MLVSSQSVVQRSQPLNLSNQKKIQNYQYDTKKLLGKGNFSTVHPGFHTLRNQPIAVKVVRLDSLTTKKRSDLLEDEISILCSMNHPSIIRCFEVLKSTSNCYIITELCEQGNLDTFLKQRKIISQEEIWPYIRDIQQGLKYLSSLGIVHRDLKTANIFLKDGKVKIADFGFAVHARQLFHDVSIGSPLYMSPEGYIDNIYGPKTDVWAFGIIVYELLHGRAPGSNCLNDHQLKNKMIRGITEEDMNPNLSSSLKQLLFCCLQVNQTARISIEDIEGLSYFRKHMKVPLNFSNCSNSNLNRCQSTPIVRNNIHEEPSSKKKMFIRESPHKLQNIHFKEHQEPEHSPKRKLLKKESKELTLSSADSSNEDSFGENYLLKGKISFNEALGLIHFCRVGFALLKEPLEQCLKGTIKNAIIKILEDLLNLSKMGLINYEIKEDAIQKQKKLKHVVSQYLEKYKIFPIQTRFLLDINCQQSKKLLSSYLQSLESKLNKNHEEVYSMNLMLIFLRFSQYLHRGSIIKDYICFAQGSILENCLANKDKFSSMEHFYQLKNNFSSVGSIV